MLHTGDCRGVLDIGIQSTNSPTPVQQSLCESIKECLRQSGFDSIIRPDMDRWKYAKLNTNLGGAAQAMISDDWLSVATAARNEGEVVLDMAKIDRVSTQELLDRTAHVELLEIDGVARGGGSTWQSQQRGKPLESPWLEGEIAELAETHSLHAPINTMLSNLSRNPRPILAAEILELNA